MAKGRFSKREAFFAIRALKGQRDQYRQVLEKVWQQIDGGPDHPWIPGANMTPLYDELKAVLNK